MIKNYYVYKNDKLGQFTDPFYLPFPEEDIREVVVSSVLSGNHPEHPEELSLYRFMKVDSKDGSIVPCLEFIVSLSEILGAKNNG